MGRTISLFASALFGSVFAGADNSNLVIPPLDSKAALPEKMLVLIPGANVATSYYSDTAAAIQAATDLKLWVVVPEIADKLCISVCPSSGTCFHLGGDVDKVIGMAKDQGYAGPTEGEGVFMSGHSLGATCADNLVQGYKDKYQALMLFGGYVANQDVADYSIPVFTLGAELDGGLGRPGYLYKSIKSSDTWAAANGGVNSAEHVTKKPVMILQGADYSDFCPGFQVPGDIFPSEITKEKAMSEIGDAASAFLHIQAGVNTDKAVSLLQAGQTFTRDDLLKPMVSAMELTGEASPVEDGRAPWCEEAQKFIAGIKTDDVNRMDMISVYKTESHPFEDTRVGYTPVENTDHVQFNVSGHDNFYGSLIHAAEMCITPAQEIGCKMASADRVAEQLKLTSDQYDNTLDCKDVNQHAIEVAEQIMQTTPAGKHALERFKSKGRPICLGSDFTPFGNIGPLFVEQTIKVDDKDGCLEVKSLKEGPTKLSSHIFPGIHYCKLLSPARVVEYYMTDGLKSKSTCLNTNGAIEERMTFLE